MASYKIEKTPCKGGVLFRVGFADPAQNNKIVQDAQSILDEMKLEGGRAAFITGPASLPVACVLAHGLGHRFGYLGVFDPKMAAYVVAISHDPKTPVGTVVPMGDVE